ncbi:MAG TPA: xanthine dehydrogenase accessory protein XdhC [Casimicrobiaceae bacterium]
MTSSGTRWIDDLVRLRERDVAGVVVTIVSAKGSVPREPGTKMIVTAMEVLGTIGGGHLELQAIGIARDQLVTQSADKSFRRFPLGASLGQCCGGLVNLLFEPVTGDAPWLRSAFTLHRDRVPFVIVSPTRGAGNANKAIVTADRVDDPSHLLDANALRVIRDHLARGENACLWRTDERDDAPPLFLDRIAPSDFRIVLFGAGHVGRALVRVLAAVDCKITWVDAREAEFPQEIPANVDVVCTDAPEAEVDGAPSGSHFLVMTHSHPLDEAICERILRRDDFAYFGLIGSLAKRRQFEKRLERRGTPRGRCAAMTCPIGIAGIPGKEPATIAIAVAAELLQAQARYAARSASVPSSVRAARR